MNGASPFVGLILFSFSTKPICRPRLLLSSLESLVAEQQARRELQFCNEALAKKSDIFLNRASTIYILIFFSLFAIYLRMVLLEMAAGQQFRVLSFPPLLSPSSVDEPHLPLHVLSVLLLVFSSSSDAACGKYISLSKGIGKNI